MQILKAMLLGLVQGFSEFFPVSSSGNLYFYSKIFDIEAYTLSFDILLHTASLIALIAVYLEDLDILVRKPGSRFNRLLGAGILPPFIGYIIFQGKIQELFYGSLAMGICFILSGAVLFYESMYTPGKKRFKNMKFKDAFIIGGFQTVGLMPAVSRTGLAICGGLQRRFDGKTSLKFAYLMAIPALGGRIISDLFQIYMGTGDEVKDVFGFFPMLLAFAVCLLSSFAAIRIMQRLAVKGKFRVFSYYMWVIGIIMLVDMVYTRKFF